MRFCEVLSWDKVGARTMGPMLVKVFMAGGGGRQRIGPERFDSSIENKQYSPEFLGTIVLSNKK